jgi:hypothetical protein
MGTVADFFKTENSQGRFGDTILAHITPEEAELLKRRGGSGSKNPKTGMPEFFSWSGPVNANPIPLSSSAPLNVSDTWKPMPELSPDIVSQLMQGGYTYVPGGQFPAKDPNEAIWGDQPNAGKYYLPAFGKTEGDQVSTYDPFTGQFGGYGLNRGDSGVGGFLNENVSGRINNALGGLGEHAQSWYPAAGLIGAGAISGGALDLGSLMGGAELGDAFNITGGMTGGPEAVSSWGAGTGATAGAGYAGTDPFSTEAGGGLAPEDAGYGDTTRMLASSESGIFSDAFPSIFSQAMPDPVGPSLSPAIPGGDMPYTGLSMSDYMSGSYDVSGNYDPTLDDLSSDPREANRRGILASLMDNNPDAAISSDPRNVNEAGRAAAGLPGGNLAGAGAKAGGVMLGKMGWPLGIMAASMLAGGIGGAKGDQANQQAAQQ